MSLVWNYEISPLEETEVSLYGRVGEPLLHPKLPKIIQYVNKTGKGSYGLWLPT
jgi:MoaA/NifB/PqqE/SkfB family radical SAM enzyme